MKQTFLINELFILEQLRDQKIDSIEVDDEKLVLRYDNLCCEGDYCVRGINYDSSKEHKNYTSCKITFIEGNNSYVEVRRWKKRKKIKTKTYGIEELEKYLRKNNYTIKSMDYLAGFYDIILMTDISDKRKRFQGDCMITIPTDKLIYEWN